MTDQLQTILVPLDGSELAEEALPLAIALARASGAVLHLTNVFVPYAERSDMPGMVASNAEFERWLEADAAEYLSGVAKRVKEELPGQVRSDAIRTRPIRSPYNETLAVVDRLRRFKARLNPDIIVMATHARGGVGRAWLGSVSDTLIRRINVPTLLVHPRESVEPPSTLFRHILVPLDGSELAEQSLTLAARLASLCGARITLLRVVIPQHALARPSLIMEFNMDQLEQWEADAQRYLAEVSERLRASVPALDTAVVVAGSPARVILDWSAQYGVDLIAMSTHGRSGLRRFVLGSISDKVVRGALVPVLLTRPGDGGDASAAPDTES